MPYQKLIVEILLLTILLATKAIVRVLKPERKIATSVWNVPEKNFLGIAIMRTINKNMELPSSSGGKEIIK